MCHRARVEMASGGVDAGQQSVALHGITETVTDLAWMCGAKFLLASAT